MQWTSALSTAPHFETALEEAAAAVVSGLDASKPDLLVVFIGAAHREHFGQIHGALAERFSGTKVVGCSAGGVVGAGREVEDSPALGLTAAVLPDVAVQPFHLEPDHVPPPDATAEVWRACIGLPMDADPTLLLTPDPFTCKVAGCSRASTTRFRRR